MIVGGSGQVGRQLAQRLGKRFPGQIIIAGRNRGRIEAIAKHYGGAIKAVPFDMTQPRTYPAILEHVAVVIVCIEQANHEFAQAALERGIRYIDISASHAILQSIEALDELARQRETTAILSVGLAPGLTNLLARFGAQQLDRVESADVFVMLGIGEAHGADALRWTLDGLRQPFTLQTPTGTRIIQPFREGQRVRFLGERRSRKAYRFDFADQHVLQRTLKIPQAATWLCFDSAFVTRLTAGLQRAGILRLTRYLKPQHLATLTHAMPTGSDRFQVQAEVIGRKNGTLHRSIASAQGFGEARATAVMAAYATEYLLTTTPPHGVYHSEQLLEPADVFHHLAVNAITTANHTTVVNS